MDTDDILEVKYDILFHDLFNSRNINLVKFMVSQILKINIRNMKSEIKIKNIRLPNNFVKEKNKYCDFVIEYQNTELIIEVNNNFIGNFIRNDVYAFSNIVNAYSVDNAKYYKDNMKFLLININFHKYAKDKKRKPYKVTYLKRTYKRKDYLLKIIDVNMDYFYDKKYAEVLEYEKFYKLITIKSKKELLAINDDKNYIYEYQEEMSRLMEMEGYKDMVVLNAKAERRLWEQNLYYEGQVDGMEKGFEQGISRGVKKKQNEMILNMYKDNMPFNTIAKYANIAVSEVKSIIKEHANKTK